VDDRLQFVGRLDILRRGPTGADARASARCDPAVRAATVALVLVAAYLLAPTMGVDLSAQMTRADFARHHALTPVDLRWFGGTLAFGYSLWVPAVMALVGVELVGALAAISSTFLLTRLLQNAGGRRPVAGGIAAAVCQAANLVEGRVAFGAAMACGLGALLAVQKQRRVATAILAILAGAANPVAALLLWLCAAVALTRRRVIDAVVLGIASGLPVLVISGLFADGGNEPFGQSDAVHALLASAVVLLVIPLRYKAIRAGAALGIVMVSAAYFIHSPVGSNATRLSLLFAIPIVVALVEFRPLLTVITIVVAVVVQVPFTLGTLRAAGSPPTQASYYRALLAEIASRGEITGRVEIPELIGHWDSYYVAKTYPLARGWLRQLDTKLNGPTFYDRAPTAGSYRAFLDGYAVEYVAVPDARLSAFGRREAAVIKQLPYLNAVWHDRQWTLYTVENATPIVAAPGQLIDYAADSITVSAPSGSPIEVNLRWSRWLSVTGPGGCIEARGRTVSLHPQVAGRFVISSDLAGGSGHC
jgi:hypothetical protein